MRINNKTKIEIISFIGLVAITITASLLSINPKIPVYIENSTKSDSANNPNPEMNLIDPTTLDIDDKDPGRNSNDKEDNGLNGKDADKTLLMLDVEGNPENKSIEITNPSDFVETSDGAISKISEIDTVNQPTPGSTRQNPPTTSVTTVPDSPVVKDTTPITTNPEYKTDSSGWTPPPPGQGTGELIWEGAENIKIDSSTSVETLQTDLGYLVGRELLNAGYNTLYPNASPGKLVDDANMNFARTGIMTLDPASYGLPEVVGYYSAKLPVKGENIVEAGDYIFDYMKSDPIFNDKVRTVFSTPKDGWLSVYQKDGFFYILYAAVNQGYSSYG